MRKKRPEASFGELGEARYGIRSGVLLWGWDGMGWKLY